MKHDFSKVEVGDRVSFRYEGVVENVHRTIRHTSLDLGDGLYLTPPDSDKVKDLTFTKPLPPLPTAEGSAVCKECRSYTSTEEEKSQRREKYLESKTLETQRVITWRKNNSDKAHATRAKRKGITQNPLTAENVHIETLVSRDNYMCKLCDQPVDMQIKWPNTLCASIDHIVPISKGGLHTYKNTQLAHLVCNMRKGNRV